jgi:hypothetical protein
MKTEKEILESLKNQIWHLKMGFEDEDLEFLDIIEIAWYNRDEWIEYDLGKTDINYAKILIYKEVLGLDDEDMQRIFKEVQK